MPAIPKDLDPVSAKALEGVVGDELRTALKEYHRAVSNRKAKPMPVQNLGPLVRLSKMEDQKTATETPEESHYGGAEKNMGQKTAEKEKPAVTPRAAPPVKPAAPAASSSRPARRPFPPPRGFRSGAVVRSVNCLFYLLLQGLREHEHSTSAGAGAAFRKSVVSSVFWPLVCLLHFH